MRQIKFRGHEFFSRKYVYSQTIRETDDGFAFWTGDDWLNCTDIEQLIAVDCNGREVYEGDTLKRFDELDADDTLSATFEDYGDILNGTLILVEAKS